MKNHFTKSSILLLLLCIINYSCTFTYIKSESSDTEKYFKKINKRGEHDEAKIYFMNGNSKYVKKLIINSDSTSWMGYDRDNYRTVSTDDINEIVFTDFLKGATGGFIIGFLGGVVVSISAAIIFTDKDHSDGGAGIAIISWTMLSTSVGTFIGAIKGDKQVYIINEPPELEE